MKYGPHNLMKSIKFTTLVSTAYGNISNLFNEFCSNTKSCEYTLGQFDDLLNGKREFSKKDLIILNKILIDIYDFENDRFLM